MRPLEWKNTLLQRHGLDRPDGRPLYQYRLSDQEFSDLSALLKPGAQPGGNNMIEMLGWDAAFFIMTEMPGWDAAFVIYGAEWWRRFYSGQWCWKGVFDSIGINHQKLAIAKRNALVESGLHCWWREVRVVDGKRRFLGTVATEGGLPLTQLQNSGGWLRNVLQPTLRKHLSRGINISVLIETYEDSIPSSYRSPELNQILADITQIIVALRREFELKDQPQPVAWLEANHPNWRDRFPLPVDDKQASALLSDLIDTASRTEADERSKDPFAVKRVLIRAETATAELRAQIDLPEFVYLDAIGLDAETGAIPSWVNLEVYEPGGESWGWCRGMVTTYRGRKALKLSGKPLRLKGEASIKALRLRFKHVGECLGDIPIRSGGYLDPALPWLFRCVDGKWLFQGAASQSIKDSEALVYVPAVCRFFGHDEDTEITPLGNLFDGAVMRLSGVMYCRDDSATYRLSSGQTETVVQFSLTGKECPFPSNPGELYMGIPKLVAWNRVSESTVRCPDAGLMAKRIGSHDAWQPLSQVEPGCYEIRLTDKEGHTQLRKRLGILAEDFGVDLRPDQRQVKSGVISLKGCAGFDVMVEDEQIRAAISRIGAEQHIAVAADEEPPINIDVSLLPRDQTKTITLTLPYPSKGALLFDAEGAAASLKTPLSLNSLAGYRLKLFDDQHRRGQKVDLELALLDHSMSGSGCRDIYIEGSLTLSAEMTEFAVYDWHPYIEQLMSVGPSIDSRVQISLSLHGQRVADLCVWRYQSELSILDNGRVGFDAATLQTIDVDQLGSAKISVINLAQPEQNFADLVPQSSQGVLTGAWEFNPEARGKGAWMIYPAKDSAVNFRPISWNVGPANSDHEIHTLAKAMLVTEPEDRVAAIQSVLREMAHEPDHRSWDYLDHLWHKTQHLPLSTFDLWRLSLGEPAFLASLFIRGQNAMLDQLQRELPVIWELVRVADWQQALTRYRTNLASKLRDEELAAELLVKKIQALEKLGPSLPSIGKILRQRLLDEQCQELAALKMPIEVFLGPRLNEEHQNLLRRQADSEWPERLSSYIFHQLQGLPADYRSLIQTSHPHQKAVTFLPWMMAWKSLAAESDKWPGTPAEVFNIQQVIRFDEDWFSAAFQYLAGWLSQH